MEQKLEEYFSSVSFLYGSIISEKKNFESLLGQQWSSLPTEEQESLLDEYFIPPHIQQLYSNSKQLEKLPESYPRLKIKGGQKIVEDDEVVY